MKRLKNIVLNRKEAYPHYLRLINVILPKPLTPREIDRNCMWSGKSDDFKKHSNLDNYIKYLKNKGVLYLDENDGKLRINNRVAIPQDENEVELTFRFQLDGNKN